MKKLVIVVFCILICLTGCQFDPYSNQRPPDYGNAFWVCDEFNIWFVVDTERFNKPLNKAKPRIAPRFLFALLSIPNCIDRSLRGDFLNG